MGFLGLPFPSRALIARKIPAATIIVATRRSMEE